MLYFLFFCSGVSGLVYQVVWVREFGNVFGNTITSASLVVAIFMLGLGAGGYAAGKWADRRYASAPESLLRTYGYVEFVIAALGLAVSLVLPHLGALSALVSSYEVDASSWHVVSAGSYVARVAVAIVLLAPIALLMGGTLTLLIRHLVRQDVETGGGWTISLLYAVNTAGAAAGALVTDFFLVPAAGLRATQMVAVALNVVAGAGALWLSGRLAGRATTPHRAGAAGAPSAGSSRDMPAVAWTAVALALAGFAAMGMEILWLRHFNLLLGGFRAVFALLITVILLGIAAGSLLGGVLSRRVARPAQALMVIQAAFVAAAFAGLAAASMPALLAEAAGIEATLRSLTPWQRMLAELWYTARPMLLEVGLPAVLMGCTFPLCNAVIQHAERAVGTRAGVLYLANTAGAVVGSLVAGYVLLPSFGLDGTATCLLVAAALAIVPLHLATLRQAPESQRHGGKGILRDSVSPWPVTSVLGAAAAIALWLALPPDFLLRRSMSPLGEGERLVAVNEGVTEVIAVTEAEGRGRALITNGHPMSSTAPLDQRYMRALAHVPLLSMPAPRAVLVIGFGVGNTTHAATLHPSVRRVEVADLSHQVLEHAAYFRDANGGVLDDERVAVYVNDGRQHLQMQPKGTYDLITLEPPPISHAGVASLYSREFYALARSRLEAGGYLSQWLPAYQVPAGTTLAMVRAFIDVFPQSVLLSGAQAELLLVGTTAPTIGIDPAVVSARLEHAPGVRADLERLDLADVTEIVGTFVSASATLARATQGSPPTTDDRPLQEYGVRSAIGSSVMGVPASLFNLGEVASWCPRCFNGETPIPAVGGIDLYLALLEQAYTAPVADVEAVVAATGGRRTILGSAYLGAVVPDSPAVSELLAARPGSARAEYEEGSLLLERGLYAEAAARFRAALPEMAGSAELHNNFGVALASMGEVASAREHFREAVRLQPGFAEARENLSAALRSR